MNATEGLRDESGQADEVTMKVRYNTSLCPFFIVICFTLVRFVYTSSDKNKTITMN
jgi:hypothetical protein